jgi:acyl-CoA thioesterase FadM
MADWIHTFKGAVLASEYDFTAHMNSRMYVSRFDQATWFLLHAVGVTPASMREANRRLAIVRQNYQFEAAFSPWARNTFASCTRCTTFQPTA